MSAAGLGLPDLGGARLSSTADLMTLSYVSTASCAREGQPGVAIFPARSEELNRASCSGSLGEAEAQLETGRSSHSVADSQSSQLKKLDLLCRRLISRRSGKSESNSGCLPSLPDSDRSSPRRLSSARPCPVRS